MMRRFHPHWFRFVMDSALVVAVILAIFSYHQPGQANTGTQLQTMASAERSAGQPQDAKSDPVFDSEIFGDTFILSNETIAGVIAAENAALTPPQYMTDLPIVAR